MILTLESTSETVWLDGVECRVWQGASSGGVPVTAFIARVAVPIDRDAAEFAAELRETRTPRAAGRTGQRWPKRMVT